ncbi:preprotein translocase subunit SecG [Sphingomonas sp. GlSt437]|uniref:preprotein translocase subunit SecG n=1 Tax=Sphingomonas sp. GlSt437 TaxID=3389970 RepID=UPI003A83FBEB
MLTFVLVVQALVAAALVGIILMQKSEGGGLGTGGSPSGLMSARGAADFLTRTTAVLATAFVSLSIILAVLAAMRHSTAIDTSAARTAPAAPVAPAAAPPVPGSLGQSGSAAAAAALAANGAAPAPAPADNGAVPLQR